MKDSIICSDCFNDEGLKLNSIQLGYQDGNPCENCGSKKGYKLNKYLIDKLCYCFFVQGSIIKGRNGRAPLFQYNKSHTEKSDIELSDWLIKDYELIKNISGINVFYYAPSLWMFGEIDPLLDLQNTAKRKKIIKKILLKYPYKELKVSDSFYRVRTNISGNNNEQQYDSPPDCHLGSGRLDSSELPILYGSQDLEICIHECRVSVEDNVFVGTLVPTKTLKLLDLTALIEEENETKFESLDLAIHFLFLGGEHSYIICRDIAIAASKNGFDGIIYPSYFSYVRTGNYPLETHNGISIRKIASLKNYAKSQIIENLALFGRPIKEGKVFVKCINKVVIKKINYETILGPITS